MVENYGPPTPEEMALSYPPQYTWQQLKEFIASGDLGLLKRHPDLQKRCDLWYKDIRSRYGTVVDYLLQVRLGWSDLNAASPVIDPPYFTSNIPETHVKILPNDWPYSVPSEIEHHLIWSKVPITHPDIVDVTIRSNVEKDGLCGFTGQDQSDPLQFSSEEDSLIHQLGSSVRSYVLRHWPESSWETAWFVNPPRLQSVRGLAHIHVFARHKPDSLYNEMPKTDI